MPETAESPYDPVQIADMIESLDREVPREGAWVEMEQYGGGPDEGQIVANRLGFLRLGIEFLKAGIANDPHGSDAAGPRGAPIDLEYLVTPDSTINFDWFELRESPQERPAYRTRLVDSVVSFGCLMLFLACVGL